VNVAAIEGTPPAGQGPPVREESNMVVVKAVEPAAGVTPKGEQVAAKCAVKPGTLVLKGVGGPKRHPFTVEVKAAGLKEVTFFVGGRKIKTFKAPAHGKYFRVKIHPGTLGKGPHHVSAIGVLAAPECAPVKASAVFVKPGPGAKRPNFTG
jgi:hypothetical protein